MICPSYAWARMLRLNIVDSYTTAIFDAMIIPEWYLNNSDQC